MKEMMDIKPDIFNKIIEKFRELDYTGYSEQYPPFASWRKIAKPNNFIKKAWKNSLETTEKLDLFINVPFCAHKCVFCFLPIVCVGEKREVIDGFISKYLKALRTETEFYSEIFKGREFSTLYMGGGTPSILSPDQINELFALLKKSFSFKKNLQTTIEMYPKNINKAIAEAFEKNGVNRVCLGVQSLDQKVLTEIKRRQDIKEIKKALNILAECGISKINIDLICGLPGQTETSFMKDLNSVIKLKPDQIHISAFINTPYTIYSLKNGKKPDYKKIDLIRKKSFDILKSRGYIKMDSDSAGLTPKSKNFQTSDLWERKSLLGLGLGAISKAYGSMRSINTISWSDYRDISKKAKLPAERAAQMTLKDEMIFYILEQSENFNYIDLKEFEKLFNKKFKDIFSKESAILETFGATQKKRKIKIPNTLRNDLRRIFYHPSIIMQGLKNSKLKSEFLKNF